MIILCWWLVLTSLHDYSWLHLFGNNASSCLNHTNYLGSGIIWITQLITHQKWIKCSRDRRGSSAKTCGAAHQSQLLLFSRFWNQSCESFIAAADEGGSSRWYVWRNVHEFVTQGSQNQRTLYNEQDHYYSLQLSPILMLWLIWSYRRKQGIGSH